MSIAHRGVELQRILKSVDRFLQFSCGCEGSPKVIPEGCGCAGITLQHGLVMGDGFIVLSLLRECETEVGLGYPITHRYIRGVLEKSDAIVPISQLRTRKAGAKHQCN